MMRRFFTLIMGCVLAGCSGGGTTGTGGVDFKGAVWSSSRSPVNGAGIVIEDESGAPVAATSTSKDGSFSLSDLEVEHATVVVDYPDVPQKQRVEVDVPSEANTVVVQVGQKPTGGTWSNVQYAHEERERAESPSRGAGDSQLEHEETNPPNNQPVNNPGSEPSDNSGGDETSNDGSVAPADPSPAADPGIVDKPENPHKPEKPEKPEKPGKPEKPEKPAKPGPSDEDETPVTPDTPGNGNKPDKPEKPGKPEKPDKPGKDEKLNLSR